MELNNEEKYDDMLNRKVSIPKCVKCKYSNNGECSKLNKSKVELLEENFDLINCPYFEETDEAKALKLFNIDKK